MKHISQLAILLTMLIGGIVLSSCGRTIEKDIMTPGGIVSGTGGGGGGVSTNVPDEYSSYTQDNDL